MTFTEGGSFEGGRVRSRKGGAVAGGSIGLGIVAFLIYQFTGVNVAPVSYTHLTLPTNREV